MSAEQFEIAFPALAAEINFLHEEAERHANMAVVYAARCGAKLLEVKASLERGQWLPWLRANCRVGKSQASKYMNLSKGMPELLDVNFQLTGNLPGLEQAISMLTADDETKAIVQAKLDDGKSVTVREIEELKRQAAAKDEEIQRLKQAHEQLFDDQKKAVSELVRQRDREKRLRKEAESLGKVSDREKTMARQKAEAEARAEHLASELASAKAQIDGGMGVAELLKPKVVVQEDPEAQRRIAALEAELAEANRLRALADQNMEEMHRASLDAAAKANRLEKSLTAIESAGAVMEVFIQQVMDLRAMAQPMAALISDGDLRLDQATLGAFLELSERLQRLVDMQRNQQALIQAA